MVFGLLNVWRKSKGFGKLAYPFRVFSNLFSAALVLVHHLENDLPISYFEYVSLAVILLFPHFFFLQYILGGQSQRIATRQLVFDFLPLGWFIGVINVSILPSFIFLLAIAVNYISVKGFKKLYRLLFIPLTLLLSLSFQGFEINLGYGSLAGIIALSYGTIHFLIVAFVSFNYANRYRQGQKALKNQKKEIEAQKEEIVLQSQKLKVLNQSLQALNNKLEHKVDERTGQLREKNKKLTEYAFINAHKLRAPVASIMGLVQFFEYDGHSSDQEDQIKDRLKESIEELEETIGGIRKKLEAEGLLAQEFNNSSTTQMKKSLTSVTKDNEG